MKKIIFAILMISGLVLTANSQTPVTGYFTIGDTSETYSVADASAVYFTFIDSSMTGTDSIKIYIQTTVSGVVGKSPVAVHDEGQATTTTYVTLLIPGDGASATYVWTPAVYNEARWTGTFYIVRLNESTNDLYAPKTRYDFRYK